MRALHMIAFVLTVIGGINWLLIGTISWGIGDILPMTIARIVYILVGISAVYLIFTHKDCNHCETEAPASGNPTM